MPIFNPGLKLLLKAANTPLEPNPDHPIAYLHFVDSDGNTIVPEYEPDGLRTSAGPVSGAKYVLVGASELQTLKDRVTALEAKRFSVTALKSANYTAASWDHVLVDMDAAVGDVTITMPASPAVNDRVKVTDMSASAGQGTALRMNVAGTFAPGSAGNWATSPHSVAYSADVGVTLKGASAELVYTSTGWIIVSETCSVANLVFYVI